MTLNLDILGTTTTADTPWSWGGKDALLYAVGIGAGVDGSGAELALTTENSRGVTQAVAPTFPVVMGLGSGDVSMAEYGDFSMTQVLHAGQEVRLHAPLPAAGSVTVTRGVSAIRDLGKHALIEATASFADADSGRLLAESVTHMMIRGEGGFGGERGPAETWAVPEREPDVVVTEPTAPNQALLYRLSGDRNPLHSDPSFAERAGFPAPILHGLCTYGYAGRAVLRHIVDGDPERFGSLFGRFSSPVFPGEALTTKLWRTEDGALFQTFVGDRLVLDRGSFTAR
ncbi:MAG: MaoC family dehydratase N-terminal domain-containing protein [Arthrobacter sp.]|jgi:acyl dehydratase|nr:MaoC family dehydratase N-terminal domain-containing protein [Arthrobacter sp.]